MSDFRGIGKPLTRDGLISVLDSLNLKVPELLAVIAVETSGCGYFADRQPAILFERHIFHKQTGGRFDTDYPGLSNPSPGGYQFGADEYPRLRAAALLDVDAALKSASWGIGQIMGFNFASSGYVTVQAMVEAAMSSEDQQLEAMASFLKASGLHRTLAVHDWTSFARGYNGPGFEKNKYDIRLAGAYQSFQQGPLPDLMVRTAQLLLTYAGLKVGQIDGVAGRMTRNAVQVFRQAHGLGDSDEVDEVLIDALRLATIPAANSAAG
jgi:hypothetical protein